MKKLLITVLFISVSQMMGMCQTRNIFNTIKRSTKRCTNSFSKVKIEDQILGLSRCVDHVNILETIVQDPNHELRKPQYTPKLINHLNNFNRGIQENLELKEEKIDYIYGEDCLLSKEHDKSQCLTSLKNLKKIVEDRQWTLYNVLNYNPCFFTGIENDAALKDLHTFFLRKARHSFNRNVTFPNQSFKIAYETALLKYGYDKEMIFCGDALTLHQKLNSNWFETISEEDREKFRVTMDEVYKSKYIDQ